jgi:hypothetical protein
VVVGDVVAVVVSDVVPEVVADVVGDVVAVVVGDVVSVVVGELVAVVVSVDVADVVGVVVSVDVAVLVGVLVAVVVGVLVAVVVSVVVAEVVGVVVGVVIWHPTKTPSTFDRIASFINATDDEHSETPASRNPSILHSRVPVTTVGNANSSIIRFSAGCVDAHPAECSTSIPPGVTGRHVKFVGVTNGLLWHAAIRPFSSSVCSAHREVVM